MDRTLTDILNYLITVEDNLRQAQAENAQLEARVAELENQLESVVNVDAVEG